MGFRQSVRVFQILGGKTHQPTRRLRVLEAETRRRPSPASSRPVLEPNRTVFTGGSSTDFLWTALTTPMPDFLFLWQTAPSKLILKRADGGGFHQ